MKTMKRIAGLLIAAAMLAACMMPAFAANAYTAVNTTGGNTLGDVSLTETMKLQWNDTPIPKVKFTYALSGPVLVTDGGITYGNASAVGGTAPTIRVGTGTAGASAEIDYRTKSESDVNRVATEYGSTITDTLNVDFSATTFSEPGIYRYTITKTVDGDAADVTAVSAIDKETVYIDVYVTDDGTAKLAVAAVKTEKDAPTVKDVNYEDEYPRSRYSLTVAKNVEGAQASRNQYFPFTVKLEGTVAGTVYPVNITNADGTTEATVYDDQTHTNPTSITVPDGATEVEQVFYLKHGQSIVINNSTSGVTYTVTESNVTGGKTSDGYSVSATVAGDDDATNKANDDGSVTGTIEDNVTVTYKNEKAAVTPTGILLAVGPAVAVIAAGAVGMGVVLAGKRRKEDEE